MSIDAAVISRWNAKGLTSTITGGVHKTIEPERTPPPYCIYSVLTNDSISNSHNTQYFTQKVGFKVYATQDDDAETFAKLVRDAFKHADRAASNPLAASSENIIDCVVRQNPLSEQITDNLYTSEIILDISYSEPQNLTPA